MPAIARTVSLTEHHDQFLTAQVAQGRHSSTSEVVREALRRYEDDVRREEAHLAYLKRLGDEGEAAVARNDFADIPLNGIERYIRDLGRKARQA